MPINIWTRDSNDDRVLSVFYTQGEVNEFVSAESYFTQASKIVLFEKNNTGDHITSMNSLRTQDDALILAGSYAGLSETNKGMILANAVFTDLGIIPS